MSLFNAFGQNGFAALAQTLENIGNIVAPIAPEEEEPRHSQPRESDEVDEENDEETFDDRIQGFFNNFRDKLVSGDTPAEMEPSSPSSFVSVELGDSPRSVDTKGSKGEKRSIVSSNATTFGLVSGVELEKKVQEKYREQLETEVDNWERKYAELQRSTSRRIALLEEDCKEWRQLAESTKSAHAAESDAEREDEINVLYEKLGAVTNDLEARQDELNAAQQLIDALSAEVAHLKDRPLPTAPAQSEDLSERIAELEAEAESLKVQLTEAAEKVELSEDRYSEAVVYQQKLLAVSEENEEQLTTLTNQLRASNKTIAALEQRLLDAQKSDDRHEVSEELDANEALLATQADLSACKQETTTLQQQLAEHAGLLVQRDEALKCLQEREAQLQAEVAAIAEKSRLAEESAAELRRALGAEREDAQKVRGELQRLQAEEYEHVESIAMLTKQAEQAAAQIRELSERSESSAGSLSDALAEVQSQLRLSEEERARLESELYVVRAASQDLVQQLSSTAESMLLHQARAEELQNELEIVRAGSENELQQLVAATKNLFVAEGQAQELQKELTTVREELRLTSHQLLTATTSASEAQSRAEVLQSELAEERAGSQDSSRRLQATVGELSAAQSLVQELQRDLVSNQRSVSSVDTTTTLASTSQDEATSPKSAAAGSSTSESEAFATLQAEYNKAIKKIKIVNKQLKEKDVEIARLKEEVPSAGMQREVAVGTQDSENSLALERESARLAAALQKIAELQEALTASEAALKSTEEVAWQAKAEAGEMLFALEQEQRAGAEAVAAQAEIRRELEECRLALNQAQESSNAVEGAQSAEVESLCAALQQEREALAVAVRARDVLQEQLTQILTDARRMNRADSMDSNMSDMERPAIADGPASAASGVDDSALASARLECSKAIKKIKIMTKQLKGKDEELTGLRAQLEVQVAEAASLTATLRTRESALAELKEQLFKQAADGEADHHHKSEADGLRQRLQDSIAELKELRTELARVHADHSNTSEQLRSALQDASVVQAQKAELTRDMAANASEITQLRAVSTNEQVKAAATERKIAELEEALTASEAALKSTEEVAWQAKAEAGELMFALEQEQRASTEAEQARDQLHEKLGACQLALKEAQAEATAGSKIADMESVRTQLRELYAHLSQASAALRFSDSASAGISASPAKDGTGTFEHLLQSAQRDLVSPLSMLAMSGKSLCSLAEQIMTHLREASERANAGATETEALITKATTGAEKISMLTAAVAEAEEAMHAARTQWTTERAALVGQAETAAAQVASLRKELDEHAARTDSELQRLQAEKQQAQTMLASYQSTSAQAMEQIQPLKAMVQKFEIENKQLHQVIAQLRQVRKTSKGESDNAIAERDELRAQCTALQGEVAMLQESLREFTANDATVAQLREDVSQIASRLSATERSLESTRRLLAQREKECYDKDAELEVTRSDMLIAQQDLERKIMEVANLQEAVSQIESEKNFAVSRYQRDLADRTSAFKMQVAEEKSRIEAELRKQLEEERARRLQLESSTQEYELFYRKADMEFNKEKKKMQRTLENALQQLSNSQAQVIDRMLVANLIVSYFKRRRSTDVLKIIAKVLAFDDEQIIAVGLKVPPIDLIGTLLTTVMGRPAPPPEVEGNNLAEQWINFLINESDQEASNSAGLVPRARSNSSGSSGNAGSPRHLANSVVSPPLASSEPAVPSTSGGGKLDPDARKQA